MGEDAPTIGEQGTRDFPADALARARDDRCRSLGHAFHSCLERRAEAIQ
jgi:hypothetical protein